MARVLSNKQKQILNRYLGTAMTFDSLPRDVQGSLESLRDYETLWSDVDRYLQDNWRV